LALEEIINAHSIQSSEQEIVESKKEAPIQEAIPEQVAATNISPKVETSESIRNYAHKSSSLAQKLKLDFKYHNRELSNQDIVNLVNSKKKLSKLLGQIEEIESKYNWS
jgi:t-SNARE complex subunit (syntaxin)